MEIFDFIIIFDVCQRINNNNNLLHIRRCILVHQRRNRRKDEGGWRGEWKEMTICINLIRKCREIATHHLWIDGRIKNNNKNTIFPLTHAPNGIWKTDVAWHRPLRDTSRLISPRNICAVLFFRFLLTLTSIKNSVKSSAFGCIYASTISFDTQNEKGNKSVWCVYEMNSRHPLLFRHCLHALESIQRSYRWVQTIRLDRITEMDALESSANALSFVCLYGFDYHNIAGTRNTNLFVFVVHFDHNRRKGTNSGAHFCVHLKCHSFRSMVRKR